MNNKRLDLKKTNHVIWDNKDKRTEEGGVTSAVELHSNWSWGSFTVGRKEDCFIKVPLLITAATTLIEKKILTEMTLALGKKKALGNEPEWRIMQIMALFVHGGILKLQTYWFTFNYWFIFLFYLSAPRYRSWLRQLFTCCCKHCVTGCFRDTPPFCCV